MGEHAVFEFFAEPDSALDSLPTTVDRDVSARNRSAAANSK
jgi:hypothetical protein